MLIIKQTNERPHEFDVVFRTFTAHISVAVHLIYCKFENFRENFILAKRHICDVKKSRLRHDLPISVNDSDFARILFSRNFAYAKLWNIKPSLKFPNLQ